MMMAHADGKGDDGGVLPAALPLPLVQLFQQLSPTQQHLFIDWKPGEENGEEKTNMLKRLAVLNARNPLSQYVTTFQRILQANKTNPYEGYTLQPPPNLVELEYCSPTFMECDRNGALAMSKTAFVLVAGGLGERLGLPANRIKLSMPYETMGNVSFLEIFIRYLLALRASSLVIMTSNDTHDMTDSLLNAPPLRTLLSLHASHFNVTLLKQDTVPAMLNSQGHIAKASTYVIAEKPHGHGDVHKLLFDAGLPTRWLANGFQHVVFFQDTNPGTFLSLPAALGLSISNSWDANILCVPRLAKSASGSIVRLVPSSTSSTSNVPPIISNVEYNVLSVVLRGTMKMDDENDPNTGFSRFPGNTNQIILRLQTYQDILLQTNGRPVADFCNPKYATDGVTFLKPTRLECLMQDCIQFVAEDKVGVSLFRDWNENKSTSHVLYAPAKNNLDTARRLAAIGASDGSVPSSEMSVYAAFCGLLKSIHCNVAAPRVDSFGGLKVFIWPRIVLRPEFAPSLSQAKTHFTNPEKVKITSRSALVMEGDITVEALDLDGALLVRAGPQCRIILKNIVVRNRGIDFIAWTSTKVEECEDANLIVREFSTTPDAEWRVVENLTPNGVLVVEDNA